MTKQDLLMLLQDIGDEDEVYMLDNGRVVPVCLAESNLTEMELEKGSTEVVMVLAPCHCHDKKGEERCDIIPATFSLN